MDVIDWAASQMNLPFRELASSWWLRYFILEGEISQGSEHFLCHTTPIPEILQFAPLVSDIGMLIVILGARFATGEAHHAHSCFRFLWGGR